MERHPRLRALPAVAATILGILTIVAYPLGFATYWVHMRLEYTHDTTIALYAASLAPVPVAAGRALYLLPAAFVATCAACFAAYAFVMVAFGLALKSDPPRSYRNLVQAINTRARRILIIVVGILAAFALPAGFAPLGLDFVTLYSVTDLVFYVCATTVAGASGLLGAWLWFSSVETDIDVGLAFRPPVQFIAALVTGTIIAAMFLIPLQSLPLATVRSSSGLSEEAKLIAHSQGYWYVIKQGDRNITALPDEAVGKVTISRP